MTTPNLSRPASGFSLAELLVVVAILGILSAFATPAVKTLMVNERIKSASFDLTAALTQARSEAIKQNGAVTLSPTSGTTSWTEGWTVTAPDASVISTQGAYTNIAITGPASIIYNRSGRSNSAATVTLQIGSATTDNITPRCISVTLTGQPKSAKGAC